MSKVSIYLTILGVNNLDSIFKTIQDEHLKLKLIKWKAKDWYQQMSIWARYLHYKFVYVLQAGI